MAGIKQLVKECDYQNQINKIQKLFSQLKAWQWFSIQLTNWENRLHSKNTNI